jgi:uncharacterized membrane protein (DUF485 family)
MFYYFGLLYIVICIQRLHDAFIPSPRNSFQDALSIIITTIYVLMGIIGSYSSVFLFIALSFVITSIYFYENRKVFTIRVLTNIALVSILLVKHILETIF